MELFVGYPSVHLEHPTPQYPCKERECREFREKKQEKTRMVEDPAAKSILVDPGPSYSCEMDGYNSLRPGDSGGEGILRVEIIC